jgi:hypothetical protein
MGPALAEPGAFVSPAAFRVGADLAKVGTPSALELPSPYPLDGFESAIARAERALTFVIVAAATIVQGNAILHHGFMGQDWDMHQSAAAEAILLPPPRWIVYVGANPPGLYWLSALVHWATGATAYIAATSVVVVGLNLIALRVWARLAQTAIRQPSLRVAALLTLAFLPFRLIHSTVFAGDALSVLPFTVVIWLALELFRTADPRRQRWLIMALSVALLAGISSKFTLASAVPVTLALLLVLGRRFSSLKTRAGALLLLVVLPGLLTIGQYRAFARLPADGPGQQYWGRAMGWRSLLMFRAADRDVLRAPQYLDMVKLDGVEVENLLVSNRHSYPALLHLSMFTDILNIFQYDPADSYYRPRDDLHQRLMTVAVWSGIPLSLLMIAATGAYLLRAPRSWRRLRARGGTELPAMILLGFSLAFFANIALFLPFMQYAYHNGYWLSRLVMPALLGACFLGFVFLDELLGSTAARGAVLAYAFAQAALHASFLWTRGP